MFILGVLSWWYGAGWLKRITILREKVASTMDYFSIDLLLRTLFSPFRQISAGKVRGPIGVQMRAFFDQLISRVIGGMVRLFMIIIGCATITLQTIFGALIVVIWAFVPFLPIIGIALFLSGWIPWTL